MYKIHVPRNPLKKEIYFLENFPKKLQFVISKQEYIYFIRKINSIFKPKYSILYILKVLTIIPLLFTKKNIYDDDLDKLIREINNDLLKKHICITHPKYNNYLYLEIIYFNKEDVR